MYCRDLEEPLGLDVCGLCGGWCHATARACALGGSCVQTSFSAIILGVSLLMARYSPVLVSLFWSADAVLYSIFESLYWTRCV